MDTSATTSATTASSTANYARLPSSTQHKPQLGNSPVISHRPPQAGFPRPLPASQPALANNAPYCTGMTVLMMAAMHGDYDLVFLHGKSMPANEINCTDARGDSALILAARGGHADVVALLLEWGAAIDQEDEDGNTALMQLSANGETGMLQLLINAGARVDMTTQPGGQTALIWAARFGQAAIAKALLQAGADPNFKTYLGYKALDYAKDNRNDEMIKLLRAAGKAAAKPRNKLLRKWFG